MKTYMELMKELYVDVDGAKQSVKKSKCCKSNYEIASGHFYPLHVCNECKNICDLIGENNE